MTKWKGVVASYAPLAALGACVFSVMPLDAALAACINGGGSNWVCSGANVTPQTVNGNNASVTTSPGFGVTVTDNNALTIQAQGALSYTDTNNSALVANGLGIAFYMQATNLGATPGSTTVNSNGSFTGFNAVQIENSANGPSNVTLSGQITATGAGTGVLVRSGWGDINLTTTGVITAGGFGIVTDQGGPGTTTINASGDVSGDSVGIQATTGNGNIGSITINAGKVTGSVSGITVANRGIGSSTVTATGPVVATGANGRGIWVVHESFFGPAQATDITVNATDVTGQIAGILTSNDGIGATRITTTGTVEALSGDGINAQNGTATGDLVINSNVVTGVSTGVFAFNRGTGATSVTTTGQVTATNGTGIYAVNANTGTSLTIDANSVTGGSTGIIAQNNGTGATTISAAGLVSSGGTGINATGSATTTDMSINVMDVAGAAGILATNQGAGLTSIKASGQITGSNDVGIFVTNGTTGTGLTVDVIGVAGTGGIIARNNGTGAASVIAAGPVTGTNGNGIDVANSATATDIVVSATDVSAASTGVLSVNFGTGLTSVTTTGQVSGAFGDGITAINGPSGTGVVVSANAASGGQYGIQASNASAGNTTITTNGAIAGGFTGILAANSGAGDHIITVNGGATGGGGAAIDTQTQAGSHTSLTINGGNISAASGVAIRNNQGDSDIVVSASAVVAGSVQLSNGSDNLTFDGSDISQLTLLDGGDDVAVADGMIDTLTFANLSGTVAGGNLANWEKIIVDSGATLGFSDSALTTGSDPNMGLFINSGGTVIGSVPGGQFTVNGTVTNAGLLRLDDGVADDRFIIAGNYVGNGGTLVLDTYLGDDTSATDQLVINGDTSGSSQVRVVNASGPGAQTTNGIKIIDVGGASNGNFTLLGDYVFEGDQAVVGGAYAYRLFQNGVSTPTDGDWYLRSTLEPTDLTDPTDPVDPTDPNSPPKPLYQPGTAVYEAYPQVLLGLNDLPTLQQRVGNRYWSGAGAGVVSQGADAVQEAATETGVPFIEGRGFWGRLEGSHTSIEPNHSTVGVEYDYDIFKLQAGLDAQLYESQAGQLIGGVTVHYGHAAADIGSRIGSGEIDTDGYGLGGTLTWYGNNGFYVDAQAQVTWYDSDLLSGQLGNLTKSNDGMGYALSLEGGKRIDLANGLTLTPQAQLVYSAVDFDSFRQTIGGAGVSLDDADSLRGRLGITLDKEQSWQAENGTLSRSHVYGIANLYHEFAGGTQVDVAGVKFANEIERTWAGVGVGGSYNWNDDKYSLYGEGSVNTSLTNFADSYQIKGIVGFRVKW